MNLYLISGMFCQKIHSYFAEKRNFEFFLKIILKKFKQSFDKKAQNLIFKNIKR